MKILLLFFLCGAALFAAPVEALAADDVMTPLGRPAIPMLHARWLVKDGAPPEVEDMAQTPDGWIWLASSAGLFRFDGVHFSRYVPPAGLSMPSNIKGLGVLDDGTLWIAPAYGNLYFLRGDKLQMFGKEANVPRDMVQSVVRDREGRTWLGSGMGLRLLSSDGKTWQEVSQKVGLPADAIMRLLSDKQGTLWAQGSTGIYSRRSGASKFVKVADQLGLGELHEAPDGAVWASDLGRQGMRRLSGKPDEAGQKPLMSDRHVNQFIVDRRGNMWFPMEGGLLRADLEGGKPMVQGFTSQQGLSGLHGNAALEDREGNIWIATGSGLDQFRARRMTELALPDYNAYARPLVAGPQDALWIDHVFLRNPGAVQQAFAPPSAQTTLISVLYRDRHGTVWSGGRDGLWRLDGLKRLKVALPPELAKVPRLVIFSIAMDSDDALWISIGPRGTWRLKDGIWQQHGGVQGLAGLPVTTMVTGPAGSLWFASVANTFAILEAGTARTFGPRDGIDVGAVMQILPHGPGALLGGDGGLAYFNGRRAAPIRGEGNESFAGASGLVLAPDGTLWLNAALGLFSIGAAELSKVLADPAYQVRYRHFDENDGLIGTASAILPLPSMVQTTSGELIISTSSGVFRFDPSPARANRFVPPVHITAISADGKPQALSGPPRLPPAPDTVLIDYTALSMALPQRVRFQYLLEGVDKKWQDVGPRRSAYYTQLAPGKYTFKVIAANDDGLWNREGATVAFEIPPTLTQTAWFRVLCALLLVLIFWGLHRLRLHAALRRQGRTFEARTAERERIARDLHDTLLQSVQALILMFRRIALRTPDAEPSKAMMTSALALAIEVMQEGRDKVQGLRTAGQDYKALGADLDAYGSRLAEMHQTGYRFKQERTARALKEHVYDELLALGKEAIRNAFIHAHAGQIDVTLDYSEKMLGLSVRDDGQGIDETEQDGRPGHWGIPGMRERAAQLGAEFTLSTRPGDGTLWRLQLPGHLAYAPGNNFEAYEPAVAEVAR